MEKNLKAAFFRLDRSRQDRRSVEACTPIAEHGEAKTIGDLVRCGFRGLPGVRTNLSPPSKKTANPSEQIMVVKFGFQTITRGRHNGCGMLCRIGLDKRCHAILGSTHYVRVAFLFLKHLQSSTDF